MSENPRKNIEHLTDVAGGTDQGIDYGSGAPRSDDPVKDPGIGDTAGGGNRQKIEPDFSAGGKGDVPGFGTEPRKPPTFSTENPEG